MKDIITEFILVRHGQTESNVAGRIQGHSDSPLTALGKKQAQDLGQRLSSMAIHILRTSDLGRAFATAQIFARSLQLKAHTDSRLREVCFGEVEGQSWDEVDEQYPDIRLAWYHHQSGVRMPGGESREEVTRRAVAVLEECVNLHAGKRVLMVTHGGVLACLLCWVLQIPQGIRPLCSIDNATVNILQHTNGHWKIRSWNA